MVEQLAAAGCALGDVVPTAVGLATSERADLVAAREVVRTGFGDHDPPSTLLGGAVPGHPDQPVEVAAVAVAPA